MRRFVAGDTVADVLATSRQLVAAGLLASIDRLGESVAEPEQARLNAEAYVALLDDLGEAGLAQFCEVSLKLSAVGQALGSDGARIALDHAHAICTAARNAGTTVTLDMEDHTTTDATLATLQVLRQDFPEVGAVLQAYSVPHRGGLCRPHRRRQPGSVVQRGLSRACLSRASRPGRS